MANGGEGGAVFTFDEDRARLALEVELGRGDEVLAIGAVAELTVLRLATCEHRALACEHGREVLTHRDAVDRRDAREHVRVFDRLLVPAPELAVFVPAHDPHASVVRKQHRVRLAARRADDVVAQRQLAWHAPLRRPAAVAVAELAPLVVAEGVAAVLRHDDRVRRARAGRNHGHLLPLQHADPRGAVDVSVLFIARARPDRIEVRRPAEHHLPGQHKPHTRVSNARRMRRRAENCRATPRRSGRPPPPERDLQPPSPNNRCLCRCRCLCECVCACAVAPGT